MKAKKIIDALSKVDGELEVKLVWNDDRECEYDIKSIERIIHDKLTNPIESTDTVYIVY